jgi:hypothetical protein
MRELLFGQRVKVLGRAFPSRKTETFGRVVPKSLPYDDIQMIVCLVCPKFSKNSQMVRRSIDGCCSVKWTIFGQAFVAFFGYFLSLVFPIN